MGSTSPSPSPWGGGGEGGRPVVGGGLSRGWGKVYPVGIDLPVAMAAHHLCRKKKSLKFTSNDDVVEVDIDFVRESERDRAE